MDAKQTTILKKARYSDGILNLLSRFPFLYTLVFNEHFQIEFVTKGLVEITGFKKELQPGNSLFHVPFLNSEEIAGFFTTSPHISTHKGIKNYSLQDAAGNQLLVHLQLCLERENEIFQGGIISLEPVNEWEDAEKNKESLISGASHDLLESTRIITRFTQLIEKEPGPTPSQKKEYFHYITQNLTRLNHLIDNLILLEKIKETRLVLSQFSPEVLILLVKNELLKTYGQTFAIEVEDLPEVIVADKAKMKILFTELLKNSIQFSRDAGECIIKIQGKELDHNWQFSISDNGNGIPADRLEEVFLPFKKLQRLEGKVNSGLGLPIAKQIVKKHRGNISLLSAREVGTTILFSIPITEYTA